jgi:calcineurin-like phosphoesterase family protein
MPEVWFTSDTHFGHVNILEYEKEARPFSNIEEMNEDLIKRWNHTVGTKDVIFHLGDFCFGKSNLDIAARLNGRKKLILGNHDHYPVSEYLHHFDKVYGVAYWHQCVLTHIPVHTDCLMNRWALNLHGHLHSRNIGRIVVRPFELGTLIENDRNYFNCSVEQNNLTPINSDVIMERIKLL